jgi:peptide/nickel transport system ATP-binding protein
MRVGDILARPLQMFFKIGGAEGRGRIAEALEGVRLDASYARRYPDQLSGGERQRVAIARALIARPELLVCDEVLSALDVSVQAGLIELLMELKRRTRMAILFISHNLAVVRYLADTVGVIYRGRILSIGAARETFTPPFHPYTHALLAASPTVLTHRARPILGDDTDPATEGRGCIFVGRCPWRIDELCQQQEPPWHPVARTLTVRCHLSREDLVSRHATAATGRSD